MTNVIVNGIKVKVVVVNDGRTREKIVSLVQDSLRQRESLATFSLAGLEKLFKCEPPKKYPVEVLEVLAEVLGVRISDFAEFEEMAS